MSRSFTAVRCVACVRACCCRSGLQRFVGESCENRWAGPWTGLESCLILACSCSHLFCRADVEMTVNLLTCPDKPGGELCRLLLVEKRVSTFGHPVFDWKIISHVNETTVLQFREVSHDLGQRTPTVRWLRCGRLCARAISAFPLVSLARLSPTPPPLARRARAQC